MWLIALAASLGAFAFGIRLRANAVRRLGPTYEDWVQAPLIGGQLQIVLVSALAPILLIALYGWPPLPAWLRATIIGASCAICTPFLVEGLKRRWRARRATASA